MDISRAEQRILHLLAQGGRIEKATNQNDELIYECFTRDGWRYPHLDTFLFRKLKRKRAIASRNGRPGLAPGGTLRYSDSFGQTRCHHSTEYGPHSVPVCSARSKYSK